MSEKINLSKGEDVFKVVHQLREPLTSIRWCSEMLLSGNFGILDKSQSDLVKEIYEGTKRLNNLVNILPNVISTEIKKE